MSDCPSCGRFIGPHDSCPYCGAKLTPRLSIRLLKFSSLLLSVVGLGILLFVARRQDVPRFSVNELGPTMNYAYIQLEGIIDRQPSFDPDEETLGFWLDDGTGQIYVGVYGQPAGQLVENRAVPRLGDRIQVAGTLRITADFGSLTLHDPENLVITRSEPKNTEIGALRPDWIHLPVRVMGVVRSVQQPYSTLTIINLRDTSGAVDVTIPQEIIALSGKLPPSALEVGASVQVEGVVTLYDGQAQISLTDSGNLKLLPVHVEFASTKTVGEIQLDDLGQFVRLSGAVTAMESFSAGVKLKCDDNTGAITILLWQDLADLLLQHSSLEVGTQISVVGEVSEFRGELEIIPQFETDVMPHGRVEASATTIPTQTPSSVTPAEPQLPSTPSPTPINITPIGEIDPGDVGKIFTLQAGVVSVSSFSAGFRFVLDDESGQIELVLWNDAYASLANRQELLPGAILRVVGEIGSYQDTLQIEPFPADLEILRPGKEPTAVISLPL